MDEINTQVQTRALQGDQAAVGQMLQAIDRMAYHLMFAKRVPISWREDCYQEMMLRALRAIPRWRASASAWPTYAGLQMRGAMLDFLRQQQPKGFRRKNDRPTILALDWDAEQVAAVEREQSDLSQLLQSSSRREQAVAFYFLEELSMKEVGQRMDLSESRVSQLIASFVGDRGSQERLRKLLGQEQATA